MIEDSNLSRIAFLLILLSVFSLMDIFCRITKVKFYTLSFKMIISNLIWKNRLHEELQWIG